ncbi:MAG: hypothetical protein LC114_08455 [Bryobacterales bacterium]|nr:hypothetical protein [Bryobacterales bacterium]
MANQFLQKLLTLQQDGAGAISSPSRWDIPPLLEVDTSIDLQMDKIASQVMDARDTGSWFFLVGSPGNGKSAAVGRLVRNLAESGFSIKTSEGRKLGELSPGEIPYLLVAKREGERFARVWIAQDASVVSDPYADEIEPAEELIELVSRAWEKGISLVVCTNRGVIEHAERLLEKRGETSPWVLAIRNATSDEPKNVVIPSARGKHTVSANLDITVARLDQESLLQGNGINVFDRLVGKACQAGNWSACDNCSSMPSCPFRENQRWLSDEGGRTHFLNLMRRAELFSGQNIVLREALALISLLLAGCPKDYNDGTPCDWVAENIKKANLFSLVGRRIYMLLYSSAAPLGIELEPGLASLQLKQLSNIASKVDGGSWAQPP